MPVTDYRTLDLAPDSSSRVNIAATSPVSGDILTLATSSPTVFNLTGPTAPLRSPFTISTFTPTRVSLVPGNHTMATATVAVDHSTKLQPVLYPNYHPTALGTVNIAGIPITGQLWPRGAPRLY